MARALKARYTLARGPGMRQAIDPTGLSRLSGLNGVLRAAACLPKGVTTLRACSSIRLPPSARRETWYERRGTTSTARQDAILSPGVCRLATQDGRAPREIPMSHVPVPCVRMFLLAAITVCAIAWYTPAATITYQYDTTDFANPERGFFRQTDPDSADFRRARTQDHVTLFRWCIGMDQFRNASLSAHSWRRSGVGLLRRARPEPRSSRASRTTTRQPAGRAAGHGAQAYRPARARAHGQPGYHRVMEAGFIGAWGEWALIVKRPGQHREHARGPDRASPCASPGTHGGGAHPMYKQNIFYTITPIDPTRAFSGLDFARTGAHNDCLGASADDWGTYASGQLETLRNYLHGDNRYVPMGGETCNPSSYSTCAVMPAEMQRMRWDALNLSYHATVLESWRTDGCFGRSAASSDTGSSL